MNIAPAYEKLLVPHLEELKKYCFYLTKSKWDGEDLLQETLTRSLTFFLHREPQADIKPFLVRVARNLWIDDCRKKVRRRRFTETLEATAHSDSDYAEISSALEWMAERMPGRSVEIWLLFHYFGYSMQEIAERFACSLSAVKSALFRSRKLLRARQTIPAAKRAVAREVERWSVAVMQDRPHIL